MGLNPTAVYFSAPGIPIKVFDQGGTRDENTDLLWEYLKAEGLSLLSKTLVANSPSDPLAGNPDSLMSMMMTNEFDQGFTNNVSEIEATSIAVQQDGGQVGNLIGIGLTYGSIKNAGIKTDSYTLPLSYSVRNQIDPRRQLTLRMPIALTSTEGAKAAQVGLGASYSFPVTDRWTLTPSVNYSLTGSIDLASAGQFASGSLTSSYFFPLAAGRKLAIGNMVGYYQTLDFTYDNLKYDPGIKSTVLRNGVMYSMPVKLGGKKMAMEYSLVDNRFFGTDLYMDSYQEVGVTLGTRKSYRSPDSYLRAGLTYIHAPNSNGFRLNVSYWF